MVMQILRSFADLLADGSKIDTAKMTSEQVKEAIRNQRMKKFKIICFCGIAMMLWRDKNTALLNKLYNINSSAPYLCNIYFAFALLCMILGVIASSFPYSAPCAMAISSNGALQAFIFFIVLFHLSIMEFYTKEQHMIISILVTSATFTIFWYLCTRDPPGDHQEKLIDGMEVLQVVALHRYSANLVEMLPIKELRKLYCSR